MPRLSVTVAAAFVAVAVAVATLTIGAPRAEAAQTLFYGGARTPTGGAVWALGGTRPGGKSHPNPCHNEIVDPATLFAWPYEPPFAGGVYFVRVCGGVQSGWRWVAAPSDLALYANSRTLELPRVEPMIAPGLRNEQLVGVPVWLWVDTAQWVQQQRKFVLAGVNITITGTPLRVEWEMGDGNTVVCDGPGTAFDPLRPVGDQNTDCSYTYASSSVTGRADQRFRVVARVVWWLEWSASEGPNAALGDVVMEQPFSVRVVEAQALLTQSGNGGGR